MARIIKFETRFPVGRDGEDWVLIAPAGANFEKTQTWHRVKSITPKGDAAKIQSEAEAQALGESEAAIALRWLSIRPAYEAWTRNEEIPETGTPLAAWAGVNEVQAAALRNMGIRTVEEVTGMDEGSIQACRWPDARKLPALAKAYLEGADATAKDAQISEMAERMAAMEEMLNEQTKPTPAKLDKKAVAA